jgi:hypothetical protein
MTDSNDKENTRASGVASSDMLGALRASGRTTRMLQEAKRLNNDGRAVYVVAAWSKDRNRLEIEFGAEYGGDHGVKFETPESLTNLDWETMTLLGAHPNCVVLVDHYAIERKYASILQMLHRFDSPNTESRNPEANKGDL